MIRESLPEEIGENVQIPAMLDLNLCPDLCQIKLVHQLLSQC